MTTDRAEAVSGQLDPVSAVPEVFALPAGDVRRKPPPILSFLLQLETLRRMARILSLLVLDYVSVAAALFTALLGKMTLEGAVNQAAAWQQMQHWLPFAYLVTVLMFARADLYAARPRRPGLAKIAAALSQAAVVSLLFALANRERFSSYYIFYSSWAIGTAYTAILRALHMSITGWLLDLAGYRRRALLVGSGRQLESVAGALADLSRTRVEVVGYLGSSEVRNDGLRFLGRLDELPEVLSIESVQEVIIADPELPEKDAAVLADRCHAKGVTVHVAASTMELLIDRAEFVPGQSVPLFRLRPPVFEGLDYALKRTVDLVLATVGLILLSPLLLIIAIAIKLNSRGPVIYRSMRPGIGGKPFYCFKFRTMHQDAERMQAELEELNEKSGALFKIREDPRLTRIGRFLRCFSMDELPQLVNVIRGQMSLVGPRPLPMRDFEHLQDWHKKRYLVLPGITGLWQVSGRSDLDFDDLVRLDFLYLERWSVLLDFLILLRTIPAVLRKRGAF